MITVVPFILIRRDSESGYWTAVEMRGAKVYANITSMAESKEDATQLAEQYMNEEGFKSPISYEE